MNVSPTASLEEWGGKVHCFVLRSNHAISRSMPCGVEKNSRGINVGTLLTRTRRQLVAPERAHARPTFFHVSPIESGPPSESRGTFVIGLRLRCELSFTPPRRTPRSVRLRDRGVRQIHLYATSSSSSRIFHPASTLG